MSLQKVHLYPRTSRKPSVEMTFMRITIKEPGIFDVFKLPQLFYKAVDEDYAFYNKKVRKAILDRNSLWHLLAAKLNKDRVILTGSNREGNIIGVLLGAVSLDGVGVVNWLYVLPEYRKNGLAGKMLSKVEKEFLQKDCHKLVVTTEIASGFYRKIGYKKEGLLKNHWWGKDFYIFSRVLKKRS